jgi:hypothetical protein
MLSNKDELIKSTLYAILIPKYILPFWSILTITKKHETILMNTHTLSLNIWERKQKKYF